MRRMSEKQRLAYARLERMTNHHIDILNPQFDDFNAIPINQMMDCLGFVVAAKSIREENVNGI